MPNRNNAERRNDNNSNSRFGIVRYSTLWLRPELAEQYEFVEWTPDKHLRHSPFVGLREEKKRP
jgi:ATP-dependent DNA ligase